MMPNITTLFRALVRPVLFGIFALMVAVLSFSYQPQPVQADTSDINFVQSELNLNGAGLNFPTDLDFGPDNRLYVTQRNGLIKAFTIDRDGPNNYIVTDTENIDIVQQIPNNNDDGSPANGTNTRLITGLYVAGTAENPVIYVTSSDPRDRRSNSLPLLPSETPDTNSGMLSRLTWNGSSWDKIDLVRGIPSSTSDHVIQGVEIDEANNIAYLANGSPTNMGAPVANGVFMPDYVFSAAIIEVDLNVIDGLPVIDPPPGDRYDAHPYIYDLPTMDDDSRPNSAFGVDNNDPFGGNLGKNQAIMVPDGPVQVYSPGYRNPYDILLTEAGNLYTVDNGPNTSFGHQLIDEEGRPRVDENGDVIPDGGVYGPGECTNAIFISPNKHPAGETFPDNMHYVTDGSYGGHPTPIRSNPNLTYNEPNANNDLGVQRPVPLGFHDPRQCEYLDPSNVLLDPTITPEDGTIINFPSSTNGLAEYTATNFGREMENNVLVAGWNPQAIWRLVMNEDGSRATQVDEIASTASYSNALELTAQGDAEIFPGTIWVAVPLSSAGIIIYEPADYGGIEPAECDLNRVDSDGDGYSNIDEYDNGTAVCNTASFPADNDGDFLSDLNDPDDDNDGIPDLTDPFQVDADNGEDLPFEVRFQSETASGGILETGFTGLMTNGTTDYLTLYEPDDMTVGGIFDLLVLDVIDSGDAFEGFNDQAYGFQFGVNAPADGVFNVTGHMEAPFFNENLPTGEESQGIFIGTGDQDNYFKFVLADSGFEVVFEDGGTATTTTYNTDPDVAVLAASTTIDLLLTVDAVNGTVQPRYSVDGAPLTDLGTPINVAGDLLTALQTEAQSVAVGIIATSRGGTPFSSVWDFITVEEVFPNELQVTPNIVNFGDNPVGSTSENTVTLRNLGIVGDPSIEITDISADASVFGLVGPAPSFSIDPQGNQVVTLSFTPDVVGPVTGNVTITHTGSNSPTVIPVSGRGYTSTPVYRVNAGGGAVTDPGGLLNWTIDNNNSGNLSPYLVNATNRATSSPPGGWSNSTDAPDVIFNDERWDAEGGNTLLWQFPDVDTEPALEFGTYQVSLYHNERCACGRPAEAGGTTPFGRIMDIYIDGELVADDFFTFEEALAETGNGNAGIKRTYTVVVDAANPTIEIELLHVQQNPQVNAIEIARASFTGPSILDSDVTSLDFDTVASSASPVNLDVILTNTGAVADPIIDLTDVSITGADAADFSVGSASLDPIPGGQTSTLTVTFTPSLPEGPRSATLVITHDGIGGTLSIPLVANVAEPTSELTVSPNTFDFGIVGVYDTSTPQTFTLENLGGAGDPDIEITDIVLTGDTPNDFIHDLTPQTIAQGTNITFDVTLLPLSAGAKSATLIITHDGENSPTQITLSGEGQNTTGPIYRVNAGAATITSPDGVNWEGDTEGAPISYLEFASAANTGGGNFSGSNPYAPDVPTAIFQSERWAEEIRYAFPAVIGENYTVNIYFAEIWNGGKAPGARVFDVIVEDTIVVDDYDKYAFGEDNAQRITHTFTAADATIDVDFGPATTNNASIQGIEIILNGTPPDGILEPDQTTVAFGEETVLETSPETTITLTNNGSATIGSINAVVFDGDTSDFTITTPPAVSVDGSNSITMGVSFTPQTIGNKSAIIRLTHDGVNTPLQFFVSGTAIESGSNLGVDPFTQDFGLNNVGEAATSGSVNLTNLGEAGDPDINITSISLSGPNAAEFSFTQNSSVIGQGLTVGDAITVDFTPAGDGERRATLRIEHDGINSPSAVSLIGTGYTPNSALVLSTSSLTYDLQGVGTTSAPQVIDFTNDGQAALDDPAIEITSVTPISGATDDFNITINNTTIPVESTIENALSITFEPTAEGLRNATFSIVHNGANTPTTLNLSGQARVLTSDLEADPTTLNFGTRQIGTISNPSSITLNNLGDATIGDPSITITNVEITGTNADAFEVAGSPSSPIPPEGNDTLGVTFGPATEGVKSATLTITHDGANSPTTVTLSGEGIVATNPYVTGSFPVQNATDVPVDAFISFDVFLPNVGQGVEPATFNDTNIIFEDVTNSTIVPAAYNTSAGFDTINVDPVSDLQPNALHRVQITSGVTDKTGAPFDPFTLFFTTGSSSSGDGIPGVAFQQVASGASDAPVYFSVAIGPDDRLYATALVFGAAPEDTQGGVFSWEIKPDGTLAGEEFIPIVEDLGGFTIARLPISVDFDPRGLQNGRPIMWVVHNFPAIDDAPRFSGSISRLTFNGATWEQTDMVTGLPRSIGDHMTNSGVFGPDGGFYIIQGGNSGMGERDSNWGLQPETVLSAAVLRLQITGADGIEAYNVENGPLNSATGIPDEPGQNLQDVNNYALGSPQLNWNWDTNPTGFYNPLAPRAPLTLYATGIRNAYDLVFHSNGELYAPANGSASGSRTPSTADYKVGVDWPAQCKVRVDDAIFGDYTGPEVPGATPPTQNDYLFRVEQNGYYGHPSPVRCEWTLNGGNPTNAIDPGQIGDHYPVPTQPDRNYRGFAYDFGRSFSPNGAIEYRSDTFGGALQGKLLVTRFSGGDDLFVMEPGGPNNDIVATFDNITGFESFFNPVDVIEDTRGISSTEGNLYVIEFGTQQITNPFENRIRLLVPINGDQPNISITPTELVFDDVIGGPSSPAQQVTITNIGDAVLNVNALELSGPFQIVGAPSLPVVLGTEVGVDDTITLDVVFDPTVAGPQIGSLTVRSNDLLDPAVLVTLRGLGVEGETTPQEPSLQWILNTYGYSSVNVGDDNAATPIINSATPDAPLLGDEVPLEVFETAGAGPISFEVLGVFTDNPASDPVANVGWYTAGDSAAQTSVFSVDNGQNRTLNPTLTGSTAVAVTVPEFGFYANWPNTGETTFTEDTFNTDTAHKTRVYELPGEENAYIVAIEDASNGHYQSIVYIVRNVQAGSSTAGVLELSTERLILSDVAGGTASAPQTVTLTNVGVSEVTISSLNTTGLFSVSSPATPVVLAPTDSVDVQVVFNPPLTGVPSDFGVKLGDLTIVSNATRPSIEVELRGLSTEGEDDDLEPSLQRILDTYNIPVATGDDDPATTTINTDQNVAGGLYVGDEVRIQAFERANTGPVTLEVLAAYAIDGNPVANLGWYRSSTPGNLQQIAAVEEGSDQTLNVQTTGTLSFDPGANTAFGVYAQWTPPPWNGRVTYQTDSLNTYDDDFTHHVRIFPLKDESGAFVSNAYVVAYEEWTQGFDFNDVVYIIRNVRPAAVGGVGSIEFENLDWATLNTLNIPELDYFNEWLVFQNTGIHNFGQPDQLHEEHDRVQLRIRNTAAQPLVITAFEFSDNNRVGREADSAAYITIDAGSVTNFGVNASSNACLTNPTETVPLILNAGEFCDLGILYRAAFPADDEDGINYSNNYMDTLTVVSSDPERPNAVLTLSARFQEYTESIWEPRLDAVVGIFGFDIDVPWELLNSDYAARGEDEVLAPYWEFMDPSQPIYMRQIAALHGGGAVGGSVRGAPNSTPVYESLQHKDVGYNAVLPVNNTNDGPTEFVEDDLSGSERLTFRGANRDSEDGYESFLSGDTDNHSVRWYPVRTPDGTLVPGVWVMAQDYVPGGGCVPDIPAGICDYNDNTYLVTNIQPANNYQGLSYPTDITVSMVDSADPSSIGSTLSYTATVSNVSIYQAPDVTATFTLPADYNFVSAIPSVGSCSVDGLSVTCNLGTILGEQSETVTLNVIPTEGGFRDVIAEVSTSRAEPAGDANATNTYTERTAISDPSMPGASLTIVKEPTIITAERFEFTGDLDNFTLTNDPTFNPTSELRINFQSRSDPLGGFDLADYGEPFGAGGNDYGWYEGSVAPGNENEVECRSDPLPGAGLDESDRSPANSVFWLQCSGTKFWEYGLPNGFYEVTVAVSTWDATVNADVANQINVEGVPVYSEPLVGYSQPFTAVEGTTTVYVDDGYLSIDPLGGSRTKIAYVIIRSGAPTLTQEFPSLLPGTYNIAEILPTFWQLDGVVCTGNSTPTSPIDNGIALTLASNEDVTCTFTNSPITGPAVDLRVAPLLRQVPNGGLAEFTVTVDNTGLDDLTNIAVTSSVASCENTPAPLASGEETSYTCQVPNVIEDFEATFAVSAESTIDATEVTDNSLASVEVVVPGLRIEKSPDSQLAEIGDTVSFTIEVENTGLVNLNNVTVTDALLPDCNRSFGTMAPGEIETYTCSINNVTSTFTNVAVASATLAGGTVISAEDSAVVGVAGEALGNILYRVNAGGAEITAPDAPNINWQANTGDGGAAVVRTFAGLNDTGQSIGGNDAGFPVNDYSLITDPNVPDSVFTSERWGPTSWEMPVPNGRYEVRLYFANTCNCTSDPGDRIFTPTVEGTTITVDGEDLTEYDIVADVGHRVATFKVFRVDVTDGQIDIQLIDEGPDNPLINGIEVVELVSETATILSSTPSSVNYGIVQVGIDTPIETIALDASGEAGTTVEVTDVQVIGPDAASFTITDMVGDPITTPFTINADDTPVDTIQVTFNPTETRAYSATLQITHDGTNGPTLNIPLSGDGVPEFLPDLIFGPVGGDPVETLIITAERDAGTATSEVRIHTSESTTNYEIDLSTAPAWLVSMEPSSGTGATANDVTSTVITVTVDNTGLPVGNVSTTVTAQSTTDSHNAAELEIRLVTTTPEYSLTPNAGANGTISPNTAQVVTEGDNATFTITPDSGYRIATLTVTDADGARDALGEVVVNQLTLLDIQSDTTIDVTFEVIPTYDITTAVDGAGTGSITPTEALDVPEGESRTFTFTPDGASELTALTITNSDGTTDVFAEVVGDEYTLTNISDDTLITATFGVVPTYDITTVVNGSGSITPTEKLGVLRGTDHSFDVAADAGNLIDNITVNGAPVDLGGLTLTNFTFDVTDINENTEIVVTFAAAPTVTINASVRNGVGGTITPSGAVVVVEGADQTFTFTPDTTNGFVVSNVFVDGVPQGPSADFTFNAVTTNRTIEVLFSQSCSPYSDADCETIPVSLATDFCLAFDGTNPLGFADGAGVATGFTMVDPPTFTEFRPGGTAFSDEVPGYEPSLMVQSGGQLTITATKGIQFSDRDPSIAPSTTESNNQVNAMGVGFTFPANDIVTFQTTLIDLNFGSNSFEQAGLWFGLGEDDYVKVAVNSTSDQVNVFIEQTQIANPGNINILHDINYPGSALPYAGLDVTLFADVNTATNEMTVRYLIEGGTIQTAATGIDVPPEFITGLTLPDGTPNISFGGIFSSTRRATGANALQDFTFEDFCVLPASGAPNTAPVVANNSITVGEGAGAIIDSTALDYNDAEQFDTQLAYTLATLPVNGTLFVGSDPAEVGDVFTQYDVNTGILSYVHDDGETTSDSFTFDLTDGVVTLTGETFTINITPIDDVPTLDINNTLTVNEGASGTIDNTLLSTSDNDTDAADITYTLTSLPMVGEVQLDGTALAISETFSQDDIDNNLVTYNHNGDPTMSADSFTFTVGDLTTTLPEATFNVNITLVNDAPAQVTNEVLTVDEGGTGTITDAELAYDDEETLDDSTLVYTLTVLPTNGTLFIDGVAAELGVNETFTQGDINTNLITYTHDSSETTADSFTFTVADSASLSSAEATFNIEITPVNDLPELIVNDPLTVAEGASGIVTQALLEYRDDEQADTEVVYTITALPEHGTISNDATELGVGDTFTQNDILNNLIGYAHNSDGATADAFSFTVTDGQPDTTPIADTFSIIITQVNDAPELVINNLTVNEGATAFVVTANLNMTDEEQTAAEITYTLTALPTNGTLTIGGTVADLVINNTFTQEQIDTNGVVYEHDDTETSSDSFSFTVTDGVIASPIAGTLPIDIILGNDAPTLEVLTDVTVDEGGEVTILDTNMASSDEELDDALLTYTVVTPPTEGTLNLSTFTQQQINDGAVSYNHNGGEEPGDSIILSLSDGENVVTPITLNIVVNPINDVPVIETNNELVVPLGSTATIDNTFLETTDVDDTTSDVLYLLTSVPVEGTLFLPGDDALTVGRTFSQAQIDAGDLTFTSTGTSFPVSDSFTFTVTDEDPGTTPIPSVFNISIIQANATPVENINTALTVDEGGTGTISQSLLEYIDDDNTAEDLTYTVTDAPANGSLLNTVSGLTNTFTQADINAGSVTYTHDGSETTSDSFGFEVSDGEAVPGVASGSFNIIVTPVNDAPVAVDDSATTTQTTPVVISVVDNDTDADGTIDNMTVTIVTDVASGTTVVNGDGTVTYTPTLTFTGTDSFTYTVNDDSGATSNTATVTITVEASSTNLAPVANDDSATTNSNTAVTINVVTNDIDPDGTIDNATVTVVTGAANGTAAPDGLGNIIYTPNTGYVGTDTFTYTVNDNDGATSNVASVTVTVSAAENTAPVANDDSATTTVNTAVNIDVVANDTDSDGTIATGSTTIVTGVANGTTSVNADGSVTYTPNTDFTGTDSFTYTVNDNDGATSNVASVTVTVSAAENTAPVANDDSATTTVNTAVNIDVVANDTDSDGTIDNTSVTIVTNATNGTTTVNGDGSVTYTPNTDFTGTDSFTYTVNDNDGATSNAATVTITVEAAPVENVAPVANDDTVSTTVDTPVSINVLANDTDSDGTLDTSSVTVVLEPTNGNVTVNPDGSISYGPNAGYTGGDAFTYTVNDDDGATSNIAVVSIAVEELPNEAPVANDDVVTTAEDTAITFSPLGNDTDDDTLDVSTLTIVTDVANGSTTLNGAGNITYTPNAGYTGGDSLTYTVNDNDGATSNVATVTITVAPVNDTPTVTVNAGLTVNELDTGLIDGSVLFTSDPDHSAASLIYTVVTNVTAGQLRLNGTPLSVGSTFTQADIDGGRLDYRHTVLGANTDNFIFNVTDSSGVSTPDTAFTISIAASTAAIPINLFITGDLDSYPLDLTYNWTHRDSPEATSVPADWYRVIVMRDTLTIVDEYIEATEACEGVYCAYNYVDKTPPYVFDNGTYTWWVQAWTYNGSTWESVISDPAFFTIDREEPTEVTGVVIEPNQGRPTITWDEDPQATWYQFYLGTNTAVIFNQWVPVTEITCVDGRCEYTPDANPLGGNDYNIWLRSWGPSGFSEGTNGGWDGPYTVAYGTTPPAVGTNLAVASTETGIPTFSWDGAAGITWYNIWVGANHSTEDVETYYFEWHLAADLGCENMGRCEVRPFIDLPNGDYQWAIQGWGPAGFSIGELGSWTSIQNFSVSAAPAGVASPVTPSGGAGSVSQFIWTSAENATWYELEIQSGGEITFSGWYRASDLGCEAGTTCTLDFNGVAMAPGNYSWRIRAYSPAGTGAWSPLTNFSAS